MKRQVTVALVACFLAVGIGATSLRRPPDAGIPNQELQKLGGKADEELAKRFEDPSNQIYRPGLLLRMGAFGDLKHPSAPIRSVTEDFVEREVSACAGQVERTRIDTIGSALQIIGQRGGTPGLKYLEGWIYDPSVYDRAKCVFAGGNPETTQSELRRDALWGIGRNGTRTSLKLLLKIAKDAPVDKYPASFEGVLNEAISENKLILKEGVDKHFTSDREFFSRRLE